MSGVEGFVAFPGDSWIACAACGTRLDTDTAIRLHRCETAPLLARIKELEAQNAALLERIAALEADAARVAAMRRNLEAWEVALEIGNPDFGHDGMAAKWAEGYDDCLRHAIEDTRAALDAARVGGEESK